MSKDIGGAFSLGGHPQGAQNRHGHPFFCFGHVADFVSICWRTKAAILRGPWVVPAKMLNSTLCEVLSSFLWTAHLLRQNHVRTGTQNADEGMSTDNHEASVCHSSSMGSISWHNHHSGGRLVIIEPLLWSRNCSACCELVERTQVDVFCPFRRWRNQHANKRCLNVFEAGSDRERGTEENMRGVSDFQGCAGLVVGLSWRSVWFRGHALRGHRAKRSRGANSSWRAQSSHLCGRLAPPWPSACGSDVSLRRKVRL